MDLLLLSDPLTSLMSTSLGPGRWVSPLLSIFLRKCLRRKFNMNYVLIIMWAQAKGFWGERMRGGEEGMEEGRVIRKVLFDISS